MHTLRRGAERGAEMLWGLSDRFVDEVIAVYRTRDEAVGAMKAMLADEPKWKGMIEVVPVAERRHCLPRCRRVRRPRCQRI
jgi:hypothetical protein